MRFNDTVRPSGLFVILSALLLIQACSAGSFLVDTALKPPRSGARFRHERVKMERRVPGITAWVDSMTASGAMTDTFIVFRGARLHAYLAPAPHPSARTAVVVHGYGVNPTNIMMIARMYRDKFGYNVLMPSLRHHGLSGGEAIQMGWQDRLDVIRWSELAHGRFSDTLQVYHGMSMGAATVMMAGGEKLSAYVRGIVADCGFSSLRKELRYALGEYAGVRDCPKIIEDADRHCRENYGWGLDDSSPESCLGRCSIPVFFIHGTADRLVPPAMAGENYEAKTSGYRELWLAPGAGHSRAYPVHPDEYVARVRSFLIREVETFTNH